MYKLINVTFLALYCSFIFWLSSKPSLPAPMLFPHQDKIYHMGAYFIMAVLAWRFFKDYLTKQNIIIISSLIFCSVYGISDEWHQSFVPGRDASVLDWVADTIGAVIALSFITWFQKRQSQSIEISRLK